MSMKDALKTRGFTILLAALVSSLVLSLGLSIVVIVRKSITLSSIGRDSQLSFYSADSGAECALYWDVRRQHFDFEDPPEEITCDGQTVSIDVTTE